ncbi:MAG: hydroxymethylbilane synthase [Gammaproteobacteria bacterium]|jgi:hydroxymethylbilane synthase|nr:hydroxymethylbilane synthase [Gammaproteobacteria bacterium]
MKQKASTFNDKHHIRIATRKSPLALWQAYYVRDLLIRFHPALTIDIIPFVTEGDRRLDTSLSTIGGKGLFVKELEKALLQNEADIAVHSIKDMPFLLEDSLVLGAVCKREDPRDTLISNTYTSLDTIPPNAIVGTSSLRRACLLRHARPDIIIRSIRGNVGTRIQKLDDNEYDAIILAAAGLKRLHLEKRITEFLEVDAWTPAPGQGAIGIECRKNDEVVLRYLTALEHPETRICITAERAVNETLEGSCQLPIAAHAICKGNTLLMRGLVGHPEKDLLISADVEGEIEQARALGIQLAQKLLGLGAEEYLAI